MPLALYITPYTTSNNICWWWCLVIITRIDNEISTWNKKDHVCHHLMHKKESNSDANKLCINISIELVYKVEQRKNIHVCDKILLDKIIATFRQFVNCSDFGKNMSLGVM